VLFCLDVRAEYVPEERTNINKYRLGGQIIYSSQAARRHLENADAHLGRSQDGTVRGQVAGLARGMVSITLAKLALNISIASLGRGHHVACKDMEELLEAEDTIRTAAKNLTRYLQVAETFNGSEVVIEYQNGEEQVHIAQNAIPLLEYTAPPDEALPAIPSNDEPFAAQLWAWWLRIEGRALVFATKKSWPVTATEVRIGAILAAAFGLLLLYEIL
jgi:hypothetical protein